MTIGGFRAIDWIYWTLWYTAWLQFTAHYYTHQCSHSRLHCRCLVAASNCGRSPSSGSPNCPRPQLPAPGGNSSQWPNRSSFLTHSHNNRLQQSQSQSEAVYRQSVRLGAKPLETHYQKFYFVLFIYVFIFATEPLRSLSLCNIFSDERMGLFVMNMLRLCQELRVAQAWPHGI
jgi:hypothetical protein